MKLYILQYLLKRIIRWIGFGLLLVVNHVMSVLVLAQWSLEKVFIATTVIEFVAILSTIIGIATCSMLFTLFVSDVCFPKPEFDITRLFVNRPTITKSQLQWIAVFFRVKLYPPDYQPALDREFNHDKRLVIAGDVVWAYTGHDWLEVSRFVLDEKQKRMLADGNT